MDRDSIRIIKGRADFAVEFLLANLHTFDGQTLKLCMCSKSPIITVDAISAFYLITVPTVTLVVKDGSKIIAD
jgi:hypothetical protein